MAVTKLCWLPLINLLHVDNGTLPNFRRRYCLGNAKAFRPHTFAGPNPHQPLLLICPVSRWLTIYTPIVSRRTRKLFVSTLRTYIIITLASLMSSGVTVMCITPARTYIHAMILRRGRARSFYSTYKVKAVRNQPTDKPFPTRRLHCDMRQRVIIIALEPIPLWYPFAPLISPSGVYVCGKNENVAVSPYNRAPLFAPPTFRPVLRKIELNQTRKLITNDVLLLHIIT